jgi:hypothetical protein
MVSDVNSNKGENTVWNFESDKESSFSPIPAGVYNLVVTHVEMKTTKKNDQRLNMTFTVTDGEFVGRKIFEGFMLSGNEKAVQIARGQLKSLLKVAGKPFEIKGPEEFMGIEVSASVKIQPSKDGYDERNNISTFKPKQASEASAQVPF